jgi:hypothetical protein
MWFFWHAGANWYRNYTKELQPRYSLRNRWEVNKMVNRFPLTPENIAEESCTVGTNTFSKGPYIGYLSAHYIREIWLLDISYWTTDLNIITWVWTWLLNLLSVTGQWGHALHTTLVSISILLFSRVHNPIYRCFKKSFTTLKEYTNLYRGHIQRFELS